MLLVEDDPADTRLIIELWNELEGTNINSVNKGIDAMDYLYNRNKYKNCKKPSLILLDLGLPMKNGFEVLKEIKTDDELKCIPVIVLTGATDNKDINKSYEIYANACIVKPIDFDEFKNYMRIFINFWFKIVTLPKATPRRTKFDFKRLRK
ncbi:response regulator [Methanobacterium veterum]|uniref:Response regulator n=1 Tax=Methanobacterium veterum TaxID=408577 RepID=A0A9E4ZV07_9EURY|nr:MULTISPECIES: response regulator [Methanobacterium]MCZ3364892.1 response regulator [Methanobacterium veterum]MCZ3372647.1 response regulator [Methanobacterium veterum]